jgi:hypothetical protein
VTATTTMTAATTVKSAAAVEAAAETRLPSGGESSGRASMIKTSESPGMGTGFATR